MGRKINAEGPGSAEVEGQLEQIDRFDVSERRPIPCAPDLAGRSPDVHLNYGFSRIGRRMGSRLVRMASGVAMERGCKTQHRAAEWASKALVVLVLASWSPFAWATEEARQRAEMVAEIQFVAARDHRVIEDSVMTVMGQVPRHQFVPDSQRKNAYQNRPLPIGYSQTISQPYIVALMTDLLGLEPDQTVLEIGTGSGYQAAILAELVARVFTIEIIPELGREAGQRFQRLGYDNIEPRVGDGYYGWSEHGPFDAIIVTAAASHIPPPLVQQLKPGGRMIIPVGGQFMVQQLTLVEKLADGAVLTRQILPVRFVPFRRGP